MDSSVNVPPLQELTSLVLQPHKQELETILHNSPVLAVLRENWKKQAISSYISDAVYYPRRYRDLKNGAISF